MGEVADMMLDGALCAGCGVALAGEADGFPRYCSRACNPNKPKRQPPTAPGSDKTPCPTCGKRVKRHGLPDHLRDAHDEELL